MSSLTFFFTFTDSPISRTALPCRLVSQSIRQSELTVSLHSEVAGASVVDIEKSENFNLTRFFMIVLSSSQASEILSSSPDFS